MLAPVLAVALPLLPLVQAYDWFDINNQPSQPWQPGQSGHNACGTEDSQDSMCQTVMINSVEDFCLWAPPNPNSVIGNTEEEEVAWCTASGHGARLMPQGTIHAAHMLKTPHYTQITGTGDFTKLNVQAGDDGGELDPHGATGYGNPRGGLVYYNGQQIQEWTSFISDSEFCIRVCPSSDPDAWLWCQHIYDIQGCAWNEPGQYGDGFDTCDGDSTSHPPGVYDVNGALSTYQQSQGPAPTPHAAGASSNCVAVQTVGGNGAVAAAPTSSSSSSSAVSSSASSSAPLSTSIVSSSSVVSSSEVSSSTISSTSTSSSTSTISSSTSTSTTVSFASMVTSTSTVSLSSTSSAQTSSTIRQAAASPSASNTFSSATQVSTGFAGVALSLLGGLFAFFA